MTNDIASAAPPRRPNIFVRLLRGLWRGLDVFRRAVHLFLMLMVFFVLLAMLSSGAPPVPRGAALNLSPSGQIVEQLSGDPFDQAVDELFASAPAPETLVRDLVDAIEAAVEDENIAAISLDLDNLTGAGLPLLQRLGRELDAFRESGRKVVAYGDFFFQAQYYIAAHADEVYMHPSGVVFLPGYGRYRMYMREALEKLKVESHIFKVGEYKSFLEPYTRDDMSDEDRASSKEWLDALWQAYRDDVRAARGLDEGAIESYVSELTDRLRRSNGNLARVALDAGLVDELRTRDQYLTRMRALVGEDADGRSFKQVGFRDYVAPMRTLSIAQRGDAVGVVVAKGDILDGDHPPGTIGGDTLARLLGNARRNDAIKAVVLRVDSGGGSKFASEIIAREVQLLREAGKPVIASMGAVAASGGYFISMDADEIWALPTTITGSIGIGAHIPTFQDSLDALGLHVDGVGTTQFSGDFRLDRDLGEAAEEVLQMSVEYGYRDFIGRVASARGMSVDAVDAVARGRVWIGATAKELGLVDRLGGLEEAIAAAAGLAGLGDDYKVRYVQKELSFRESLALQLAGQARTLAARAHTPRPLDVLAKQFNDELTRLARFNDPQNLYYYCFCSLR